MPTYEFVCPSCGAKATQRRAFEYSGLPLVCVCDTDMRRVWSPPAIVRGALDFEPHFNSAVGKPVSTKGEFRSELSRMSDEATERTGVLHDYQPINYLDHEPPGAREQRRERDMNAGRVEPRMIL